MKSFSAALVRQQQRSGTFRRLVALCRKETLQIWRDPSSILIAVVLPIAMLFIFGFGINLDSSQLRVGLVIEDQGAEVQRFIASFTGSPYLRVITGTRPQMEQALADGKIRGLVVVPSDFTEKSQRPNDSAPIQIIIDGSEPNTAKFVEAYAEGAWQVWQRERAAARAQPMPSSIQINSRFWFNPSALSRNYIIPGSITIIMTVLGALLTSLVVAREWERGTMEALLATSITRAEFLISKLLPYYVLGMVSELICIAVAVWILKVPFRGSILMTLFVTTFFLFSALGLGLLLSTATRNQFDAAQGALNAAFLPSIMLSGFLFEISSMPLLIRLVTYLIPARYFVNAMQTLFQAGHVPQLLWRDVACLMASSIFFIGLTARLTKMHLD